MKKFVLLICVLLICAFSFYGCDWSDKIVEGTYVCKTPYIQLTYDYSVNYMITQKIEIDKKVYKAISETGHGEIFLYEYKEDDIRPSDGLRLDDNEIYAKFDYKFDDKKKQLILTDQKTGNVYHLDKVE